MPFTYQIDSARRWLDIRLMGVVFLTEAAELVQKLFADPAYSDELSGLIDCREMTNVLNVSDLRGLADLQLARPEQPWRSKRAVLVASPEQYGTGRLFTVFTDPGPVQYSVFYNLESALAWVKEN